MPVSLCFSFDVATVPSTAVHLLVEGAEQFQIALNGQPVSNKPVGWYLDRSFHKVLLPALRTGANMVELSCGYTNHMELEDCFLLGDFGVSTERVIVGEPTRLHLGDWTSQGYLHYPGSIVYHSDLNFDPSLGMTVKLWLGGYAAVHVLVHVNGSVAGHVPWPSENGLDISEHLGAGLNNIDIEVVSSPRNMLGPLHLKSGREPGTSWESFRATGERHTDEYVTKMWGLYEPIKLEQTD